MRFSKLAVIVVLLLMLALLAGPIYRWVDEEGNVHFSDTPPAAEVDTAEEVVVDIAPAPERPDEGELRRRALLEQAEIDTRRRLEAREQAAAAAAVEREARQLTATDCLTARQEVLKLQHEAPVYLTSRGELRVNWIHDAYRGERRYLNDADRARYLARARERVRTFCSTPDDPAAMLEARRQWIRSERCEEARAELEHAEKPESHTPRETVEGLRRRVDLLCNTS